MRIKDDGLFIHNDEFCIENDEFNTNGRKTTWLLMINSNAMYLLMDEPIGQRFSSWFGKIERDMLTRRLR